MTGRGACRGTTGEQPGGTLGYAGLAPVLADHYEAISFDDVHPGLALPPRPARILDIGAGTGRDAAHLAGLGYTVTAAEPVAEMRAEAQRRHSSARVTWLEDALPGLTRVKGRFDLILITAVWMHLDLQERRESMPCIARLLAPNARLVMSLRHGPLPAGRVMYQVSAQETIALALACGLVLLSQNRAASVQPRNRAAKVSWTRLEFAQAPP